MTDTVKLLPSGYWHVRFDGWFHGFAQWSSADRCDASNVSVGQQTIPDRLMRELVDRANAAADAERAARRLPDGWVAP